MASALYAIDDDILHVLDISHEGNTSSVEFEWIGLEHSLEGGSIRGAHNTSIDAFLIAETRAGRRRAYLMEWKYVERYLSGRPEFKGAGSEGDTCRLRYAERYRSPFSSFNQDTAPDMDDFLYEPFYQIMRQRLLGGPDGPRKASSESTKPRSWSLSLSQMRTGLIGPCRTAGQGPHHHWQDGFPRWELWKRLCVPLSRIPAINSTWWPRPSCSMPCPSPSPMKLRNGPVTGRTATVCNRQVAPAGDYLGH